ncbi:NAD(P)/FAD-dependent oxidoreductase [Knoellia locipacati]|uniref:NAD(P)/FAD-dependent oxidoreductase n=1 Tax=Knoellia locipacati TaxID=882824 RepID=UPI001FE7A934|nr:NAD(P)/FAD-dependent oxidoreductase [Knoellia locipacati]
MPDAAGVVVIGAGPAGSAAAAHLSAAGCDVLVLERTPDASDRTGAAALTPAAVRELEVLGLGEADTAGWHRTTGVRFVGGGMRLALAWPDASGRPAHGLVTSRSVLDETLVSYAVRSGARVVRGTEVTGLTRDAAGRVDGVATSGGAVRADLVIDASGATSVSHEGTTSRGAVAVTADFESPRHTDDHVESWLRLSAGDGAQLPGHGWIVGRGDGHVSVGVGALADDTTATPDACAGVLRQWLTALPANWQLTESTMTGPVSGARLSTGRPASPRYADGVLAVGDAAAVANPVTGEGLAAALTSARLAAVTVARALGHPGEEQREAELTAYDAVLARALGGHRTLGRAVARLADRPLVTRLATTWALPHEPLMSFVLTRATAPAPAHVETGVTPSTMGPVTRAAAHPGTERGVDQR